MIIIYYIYIIIAGILLMSLCLSLRNKISPKAGKSMLVVVLWGIIVSMFFPLVLSLQAVWAYFLSAVLAIGALLLLIKINYVRERNFPEGVNRDVINIANMAVGSSSIYQAVRKNKEQQELLKINKEGWGTDKCEHKQELRELFTLSDKDLLADNHLSENYLKNTIKTAVLLADLVEPDANIAGAELTGKKKAGGSELPLPDQDMQLATEKEVEEDGKNKEIFPEDVTDIADKQANTLNDISIPSVPKKISFDMDNYCGQETKKSFFGDEDWTELIYGVYVSLEATATNPINAAKKANLQDIENRLDFLVAIPEVKSHEVKSHLESNYCLPAVTQEDRLLEISKITRKSSLPEIIDLAYEAKAQNNYFNAVEYFRKALKNNNDTDTNAMIVSELFVLYREMGRYQEIAAVITDFVSAEADRLSVSMSRHYEKLIKYLVYLDELLYKAGQENMPYAKLPSLIKIRAEKLLKT